MSKNNMTKIEMIRMLTAQLERATHWTKEYIEVMEDEGWTCPTANNDLIRFNEAISLGKEKINESRKGEVKFDDMSLDKFNAELFD